jgi:hypothetical protein
MIHRKDHKRIKRIRNSDLFIPGESFPYSFDRKLGGHGSQGVHGWEDRNVCP